VAFKELLIAQIKGLKDAAKGNKEMPPDEAHENNGGYENEEGKTEVRFKDLAQLSWENFQPLKQYATYLKLAAYRAKYEAWEELVKLKKNGKELVKKKLKVIKKLLKYAKKSEKKESDDEESY